MTTREQARAGFGVEQARALAASAHAGQVDKSGGPYIAHVERVAAGVAAHGPDAAMAAWLHDLVEDSGLTLADLEEAGVPPQVLDAVDALTKRPGEPYLDAVRRAAAHPLARLVKLADNADNSDETRLAALEPTEAARLRQKYAEARAILLSST